MQNISFSKLIVLAAIGWGAASSAFALEEAPLDEDTLAWCIEYNRKHDDGDSAGCQCLAEQVVDYVELKPEISQYDGDLNSMSEGFKMLVEICWPEIEISE
tara:strand:+ start:11542 stop:11844 length:303 start_codon:yes stop_codon:yes gene_type:complete